MPRSQCRNSLTEHYPRANCYSLISPSRFLKSPIRRSEDKEFDPLNHTKFRRQLHGLSSWLFVWFRGSFPCLRFFSSLLELGRSLPPAQRLLDDFRRAQNGPLCKRSPHDLHADRQSFAGAAHGHADAGQSEHTESL